MALESIRSPLTFSLLLLFLVLMVILVEGTSDRWSHGRGIEALIIRLRVAGGGGEGRGKLDGGLSWISVGFKLWGPLYTHFFYL